MFYLLLPSFNVMEYICVCTYLTHVNLEKNELSVKRDAILN